MYSTSVWDALYGSCLFKAHSPEYLPCIGQLKHARASTTNPGSDHLCFQLTLSFTATENIGITYAHSDVVWCHKVTELKGYRRGVSDT